MIAFLKSLAGRRSDPSGLAVERRNEVLKNILREEFTRTVNEKDQLVYRRLDTIMALTGAGRRKTLALLSEIGARPSSRFGKKLWTLSADRKESPGGMPGSPPDSDARGPGECGG